MADIKIDKTSRPVGIGASEATTPRPGELDIGGPIGVRIEPAPFLPSAAAFYDKETETLTVHIMPFEPYCSFLELGHTRIDTDEAGRPVFIEIAQSSKEWRVDSELALPPSDQDAVLRFRQTRRKFASPEIIADPGLKVVCLKFLARRGERIVRVAENLLAEVADGFLVALWVGPVRSDFGEHQQARWRASTASRLRREGKRWQCCSREGLSENCLLWVKPPFFS